MEDWSASASDERGVKEKRHTQLYVCKKMDSILASV
jgi:hypothetical protein